MLQDSMFSAFSNDNFLKQTTMDNNYASYNSSHSSFSFSSGLEFNAFRTTATTFSSNDNNNSTSSSQVIAPSQNNQLNQDPRGDGSSLLRNTEILLQRQASLNEAALLQPGSCNINNNNNRQGYDNHNMPPSKVVHCRAVADGCKETDLVQVMRPFGNIKALTLMPKLRQALVEFEDVESAITCVSFASQLQPILVLGRQMYVNYSKSTEINRDFSSSASVGQTPTNILLFTIINAIHPVNVETVKKISQQHAEVQRIVIFHKNGLQALVEFLTIDDAQNVQQALNGCDIFAGCCTLKIDFSKTGRLNVHANTTETYDVEIEKRKRGGSLLALMNHSIEAGSHTASSKSSTPMDFPLKDPSPIGTGSLSTYTSALQAPMQPTTQSSMTGSSSMTSLSSQTQESRQPPNLSALHSMNEVFSNLSQQKPPSPPHQPPTPTQPTVPGIDTSKLNQEAITALLAGAAGFPAVQSIIAKVMAPNPSSSSMASHTSSQYSSGLNNLLTSSMDSSADSDSGSSSMSSGINRTTLLTGMPNSMDSFSSPFAALGGGLSMAGGEGCVAMVYGVNSERMNCDHLFNLFCLYGNVVKVKTLVNKPGAAMIQYTDKMSTDISIRNLNNLTLFGQKFQLSFSKHPFIADASQVTPLFDGSPSAVSYADSRNNRFKYIPGGVDIFSRIHPPSKVLHYFNAPPDCSEDHLKQVFHSLGAEIPIKQATFSKSNGKSSSGLLEFSSVPTAVEALILANHFTMQRDIRIEDPFQMLDKGGAAYTLKLAFSPSNAINN
eukprot:TCONS_00067462-protein